jgi:choline dehydrogenase-like flavoprotein
MLASLMQAAVTKFADSKNITSRSPSTVHIFGSLPINSEIYEKGSLRLKRNPNVFICDGSILPFGPGVNPQAIIMSSVDALFKDFS